MSLDPLSAALDFGGKLLDKFIPDPAAKAAAQLELVRMQQTGELARLAAETDIIKGQLAINEKEAESASLFVSGWRPAVGWVCVAGLAYTFIIRPLAGTDALDIGDLMTLLLGMLGMGGLRTAEKIKGVAAR